MVIQSDTDYTRPEMLKELEDYVEKYTVDFAKEVIKKTQGMGTDIFGFGNQARYAVDTWPQWEKLNWGELYPKAEIEITVAMSIRRIGLQFQPAKSTY
ncbi:MAG: Ger(x)C family spore germination C-terminal domain-containing protein [Clostridia bacterium]|nr:Ger(x)C family spore germination C-terminal domain-containing protein [Clostridia bacterium]